MMTSKRAPRIEEIKWGHVDVVGHGRFRDAKIWPGGARGWDWNETGTHHMPGIQPADVQELLDHGATTVILSQGFNERLRVKDETLQLLNEQGITVEVLETGQAMERFNELREETAVGGLFHSTC